MPTCKNRGIFMKKGALALAVFLLMTVFSDGALAQDSAELIVNGGLESLAGNGEPVAWEHLGGFAGGYSIGEGISGNGLKMANSGAALMQSYQDITGAFETGEQYVFSVKVNPVSLTAGAFPALLIYFYDVNNTELRIDSATVSKNLTGLPAGIWSSRSFSVTIPSNTGKMRIYLRLFGAGEVIWDDVSLTGKAITGLPPLPDPNVKPPVSGASELCSGGGFEQDGTDWLCYGGTWGNQNVSTSTGTVYKGSKSAKLYNQGSNVWIRKQFSDLPVNARYMVSLWVYTGDSCTLEAAFKFFSGYSESAGTSMNNYSSRVLPFTPVKGRWQQVTYSFSVPEGCKMIQLYPVRLISGGTVYIDEVSVYMTKLPPKAFFETDNVFYYTDYEYGKAVMELNTVNYPNLAGNAADFAFKDGAEVLCSKQNVSFTGGMAEFSFDAYRMNPNKAYTVEAVLKDSQGAAIEEYKEEIYKYPRPGYINEEGKYIKDGRLINPVIGYHVNNEHYSVCAQAGINVVQGNTTASIELMREVLNAADAEGLMVMMPLYRNMKPAGHPANTAFTVQAVTELKDHPALFGWAVMDEPLSVYGLNTWECEEWLKASYQIIHQIDSEHPVMAVESTKRRDQYKNTGKYVDVFMIDPYVSGIYGGELTTFVGEQVSLAIEAVKNKKPVYSILQAFEYASYFPTADEIRHMAYQAFLAGAKGIGYYCIDKSTENGADLNETDRWAGLKQFKETELEGAFGLGEARMIREYCDSDMAWYDYVLKSRHFVLAMNKKSEAVSLSIPMPGAQGSSRITVINGGTESQAEINDEVMTVDLLSGQAVLYEVFISSNLIINGDFENGHTNWQNYTGGETGNESDPQWSGTVAQIAEEADGNHCLKFVSTSGNNNVRMTLPAATANKTPGQKYKVSFRFKWDKSHPAFAAGNAQSPLLTVRYGQGYDVYNRLILSAAPENTWTQYNIYITVPGAATLQGVTIAPWTSGMSVYYDDVCIKPLTSEVEFSLNNIDPGVYTQENILNYLKGSLDPANANAEIYVPAGKLSSGDIHVKYTHVFEEGRTNTRFFAAVLKRKGETSELLWVSDIKNINVPTGEAFKRFETLIPFEMPPLAEGETCTLTAFVWDGMSPYLSERFIN